MSNPKKPTTLKLLEGTYRGDRDGPRKPDDKLPVVSSVPAPPTWLKDREARREWQRLATMLAANHLLVETSLSPLAVLCALYGRLVQAFKNGELPTASLLAQYRCLSGEFGCTPITLAKLPSPRVHKSDNPFARFGKPADNPFAKNGKRPH